MRISGRKVFGSEVSPQPPTQTSHKSSKPHKNRLVRPMSFGLGIVCAADIISGGFLGSFASHLYKTVSSSTACLLGAERMEMGCEINAWANVPPGRFSQAAVAGTLDQASLQSRSQIPGLHQLTRAEVEQLRQGILQAKSSGAVSARILSQLSNAERQILEQEDVLVADPDAQARAFRGESPLSADQLSEDRRAQLIAAGALPRFSDADQLAPESRQSLIDGGQAAAQKVENLTPDQREALGYPRFTDDEIQAARRYFGI